jgi:hypothetical protein
MDDVPAAIPVPAFDADPDILMMFTTAIPVSCF